MGATTYFQENQPPGVPPLSLTGERTLPDVPAENYWYRRHLAVYEWIAARVGGQQVIDMACGEGYGSAVLAEWAAEVTGVDANPEAFEHARLRYQRPGLSFARALVNRYGKPDSCDAITFLQTIEHVEQPERVLTHFRSLLRQGGIAYVSTPNVLTLASPGAEKSDNPWHLKEYRAQEFRALCELVFDSVEIYGLYHAGKLRTHAVALSLGWDRIHRALGLTDGFYRWFTPAISSSDFTLDNQRPLYEALDFLAVCR
jgi:2-polyprenyl-3-methyl-5-hydroxy-6-metoxy-1,4-benzoquinol methylase